MAAEAVPTVGSIRLKPLRYLAHYLTDLKLRLEFGRKRSCLNFVPFRTICAPCYTYSNARKTGRYVFLVTIVQSISHHLSLKAFLCISAFFTNTFPGGSPTYFGLGMGPITHPGPAMVRTDRKDLNSNKTKKQNLFFLPVREEVQTDEPPVISTYFYRCGRSLPGDSLPTLRTGQGRRGGRL